MDFAAMMVIALEVCGVIWLIDARLWAPRRRAAVEAASAAAGGNLPQEERQRIGKEPLLVEYARSFILVNKFAYGIRLPVVNLKFIDIGKPQRGDVVVFRYPEDPSTDYIKRIVGLPGDRIEYHDKTVFINGTAMPQQYIGPYTEVSTGVPLPARLQVE